MIRSLTSSRLAVVSVKHSCAGDVVGVLRGRGPRHPEQYVQPGAGSSQPQATVRAALELGCLLQWKPWTFSGRSAAPARCPPLPEAGFLVHSTVRGWQRAAGAAGTQGLLALHTFLDVAADRLGDIQLGQVLLAQPTSTSSLLAGRRFQQLALLLHAEVARVTGTVSQRTGRVRRCSTSTNCRRTALLQGMVAGCAGTRAPVRRRAGVGSPVEQPPSTHRVGSGPDSAGADADAVGAADDAARSPSGQRRRPARSWPACQWRVAAIGRGTSRTCACVAAAAATPPQSRTWLSSGEVKRHHHVMASTTLSSSGTANEKVSTTEVTLRGVGDRLLT